MFYYQYCEIYKNCFCYRTRLVVASEEPMTFSIYLKNRLLLNVFVSWLSQIMVLFVLAIAVQPFDAVLLSLRNYRYASYKQFTWWIHSKLGKGVQKVIPSCVVWSIRKNYPSENGVYTDFKQAENN